MSDETNTDFPSSADRAVDSLHRIDEKVNRLREDRLNDPDSLGDKLIKSAVPALAGLVAGKAFQMIWDKGTSKRNLRKGLAADAPQGLAMSLVSPPFRPHSAQWFRSCRIGAPRRSSTTAIASPAANPPVG